MSTMAERFELSWGKKVLRADEPGSGVLIDCIPVVTALRFAAEEVAEALAEREGEAQRTVWVGANSVVEAINKVRRARSYNTLEAATGIRGGPYWEVRLIARRCERVQREVVG